MAMPPNLKKKLSDAGASISESESPSESESESESGSSSASPAPKGGKMNPLKQWAKSKM